MKWWAVLLIVLGCLGVGCVGGFAIGFFTGGAAGAAAGTAAGTAAGVLGSRSHTAGSASVEANATAQITAPASVTVGDEFDVRITITNTASTTRAIGNIDFYTSYLDHFSIMSTDAALTTSPDTPHTWQTFNTSKMLVPNGTLTFTWRLRAVKPGTAEGDIDVYVDEHMIWDTVVTKVNPQ